MRCLRRNRSRSHQHHVAVPVRHWYVPRIRWYMPCITCIAYRTTITLFTAGSDGVVCGGLLDMQAVHDLSTYGPRTAFIWLVLRGCSVAGTFE
ncbi:hypothetical protein E2C01_043507 [Portunus trituberculatus]|uniref:Uncharacterized protein n=1 Tax=Portunus trituberculatus TaxID=210409 RepID=A0A5B7FWJ9_PORTR|nr:hypothetical protein [Portunus trituberculatus]